MDDDTTRPDIERVEPARDVRPSAVVHVADNRYLPLAVASAASAADRLGRPLAFRLLLVDVDPAAARAAEAFLVRRGLDAVSLPVRLEDLAPDWEALKVPRDGISRTAYARFAAPDLLPDFDTLIYLDCDTLVTGDLAELALISPAGLAAVAAERSTEWLNGFYGRNGLPPAQSYFNSGVMLMNAALWRQEGIGARAFAMSVDPGLELGLADQDVLNLLFGHAFHRLHPRWNFTKGASWALPDLTPAIAHFAGRLFPWDPRERRCPATYRNAYARLFADLPPEIAVLAEALRMPQIEVRRARDWSPMLERLGLKRRSGWNPAHAAMLERGA